MLGYYLFAIFCFALVGVLVLFAKFLFSAKRKPEDLKIQEEKLLRLYRQIEDMLESFEEYAEEVRREISDKNDEACRRVDECEKRLGERIENEIQSRMKVVEKPVFREVTAAHIVKPAEPAVKTGTEPAAEKSAQALELEKMKKQKAEKTSDTAQSAVSVTKSRNDTVIEMYESGDSEEKIAKTLDMNTSEVKLVIQMKNARRNQSIQG